MPNTIDSVRDGRFLPFDEFVAIAHAIVWAHEPRGGYRATVAYFDVGSALRERGDAPLPSSLEELRQLLVAQGFTADGNAREMSAEIWADYKRTLGDLQKVRK